MACVDKYLASSANSLLFVIIIPPPPEVIILFPLNDKHPISPTVPTCFCFKAPLL